LTDPSSLLGRRRESGGWRHQQYCDKRKKLVDLPTRGVGIPLTRDEEGRKDLLYVLNEVLSPFEMVSILSDKNYNFTLAKNNDIMVNIKEMKNCSSQSDTVLNRNRRSPPQEHDAGRAMMEHNL
jgi:hypothetical protein